MFKYKIHTIPGTEEFVKKDLLLKFPEAIISTYAKGSITFSSIEPDMSKFRQLLSALHIENQNGKVINLFRRNWKLKHSPAGINPALAYILCDIAEVNLKDIVYDPFCGAGTIPITAKLYFNAKKVLASDLSGKAIDMAQENFKNAGIKKNEYLLFRSGISQIKIQEKYVNKIISNLPFGIRTGDHEKNIQSYQHLASKAKHILSEEGKVVIYTQEKKLVTEAFKRQGFKLISNFDVEVSRLYPSIFVFKI